jgi:hypothetical protein
MKFLPAKPSAKKLIKIQTSAQTQYQHNKDLVITIRPLVNENKSHRPNTGARQPSWWPRCLPT